MTWRLALWLACIATEAGALVGGVLRAYRSRTVPGDAGADARSSADETRRSGAAGQGASWWFETLRGFRLLWRSPLVVLLACALAIDLTLGFTDPLDRSAWSYGLNAFAASGPRPRTPLVRLAYHLADGLAMAWPLAVAWASGRVFAAGNFSEKPATNREHGNKSSRIPTVDILAGLFLGLVIGMATAYPLRPGLTRWLLWAWEAVCVAAAWAGVARGWPGRGGAVETAAIVLVACETMVATVGPFLTDPFTRWWIATAFYCAAFAAVGVVLGRARRPGVS